ncbi:MAG: hypothetical protein JNK64_34350 [Myxococcales bacterium]|nr:hypothetical protein [Myxococcales bacterium]
MIKHVASLALALAVVAAAGCGGSQKSGGGSSSKQSCATAAANAGAQVRAIAAGSPDPGDAAKLEPNAVIMERVMAERCEADAWSAAAIDCIATATAETMQSCEQSLTQEQRDAVGQQMEREIGGGGETESAPPPPPDDPCGGGE